MYEWNVLEGDHELRCDDDWLLGTGAEDFFGGAYYFWRGPFARATTGAFGVWKSGDGAAEASVYRHHLVDGIECATSFTFRYESYEPTHGVDACVFYDASVRLPRRSSTAAANTYFKSRTTTPTLNAQIGTYLADARRESRPLNDPPPKLTTHHETDAGHGRIEERTMTVSHYLSWIDDAAAWKGLAGIARIARIARSQSDERTCRHKKELSIRRKRIVCGLKWTWG